MKVLVACEFSGVVREAFKRAGHYAVSCDLLETATFGNHMQCDVRAELDQGWDLMIAFPPCTHLCVSGARWFKEKEREQLEGIAFFLTLASANIPRIAIENPVGIMSTWWRKPDQIIQPWQFGHGETKATCLWLKNLPKLIPTEVVSGRENRIHKMPPSKDRGYLRSITYSGIAQAMADQWGSLESQAAA
jgi:hypothetical protein